MSTTSWAIGLTLLLGQAAWADDGAGPRTASAARYPSIQAALDANPGMVIHIPPGDYRLDQPVVIDRDGAGLSGPGQLIQTRPDAAVIVVRKAPEVCIERLWLTRAEGAEETSQPALEASGVEHLAVVGVRVSENRSQRGSIEIHDSRHVAIRNCLVLNYSTIAIDDRTGGGSGEQHYGYAFRCIDGTGIIVKTSRGRPSRKCRRRQHHRPQHYFRIRPR